MWCEACRDHYDDDHYDENGNHRRGVGFGTTGADMQRRDDLERALSDVVRAHQACDPIFYLVDEPDAPGGLGYGEARELTAAIEAARLVLNTRRLPNGDLLVTHYGFAKP